MTQSSPESAHPPAAQVDPAAVDPEARRKVARGLRITVIAIAVLLALGAGRTVVSRIANAHSLDKSAEAHAVQYVRTTLPKKSQDGQQLSLPGSLQGYVQSPISSRASGYLKRWTKDIGSVVKQGDLLAEIETPEIDQQLSQANAARDQAASTLALAKSTAERWDALHKKDVVSQQEVDERRSAVIQQQANLAAADANVQRLQQTEGFKNIVAPFAGVITRRNVDVGDLIEAGGGTSRPLFLLSQTDPLRVYINVPQTYSQLVRTGQPVTVTQSELAGQKFQGTIARTAASIDLSTRTMQVEVSLPNKDGVLLPGAYVQVALPLLASASLRVPGNTLLFRAEGTRIAVVDDQGKITLKRVDLGRNFGDDVEVLTGLQPTDRIVLNPSDSLADGDTVSVQAPDAPPANKPGTGKDAA